MDASLNARDIKLPVESDGRIEGVGHVGGRDRDYDRHFSCLTYAQQNRGRVRVVDVAADSCDCEVSDCKSDS